MKGISIHQAGRLVVYGDSSCLEGGAARPCHWLLLAALQYALVGHMPSSLLDATTSTQHRDVNIIPSGIKKLYIKYKLMFAEKYVDFYYSTSGEISFNY